MTISRRWLYRVEAAASVLSFALFALTIVYPMWIERWFDESPDRGDGSVERLLVGGAFLVAAACAAALARRERRHAMAASER